jgi:hypothetical protein
LAALERKCGHQEAAGAVAVRMVVDQLPQRGGLSDSRCNGFGLKR